MNAEIITTNIIFIAVFIFITVKIYRKKLNKYYNKVMFIIYEYAEDENEFEKECLENNITLKKIRKFNKKLK